MAVSDYNREKTADCPSYSGSPTISKAQFIKCTDGDDSTTGTGDIVIDFANISGESDFAVYDNNDNLLPYEIETFDTTGNVIEAWVYAGWVADGTTQLKVVYGNGPASSEENVSGTWNNAAQNVVAAWHFDDASGPADDSTPNANDLSLSGPTLTASGQFDGYLSFDGTDDTASASDDDSLDTSSGGAVSCAFFIRTPSGLGTGTALDLGGAGDHAEIVTKWNEYGFGYHTPNSTTAVASVFTFGDNIDDQVSGGISAGTWYSYVGAIDFTTDISVYEDGSLKGSDTTSDDTSATTNPVQVGGHNQSGDDETYEIDLDATRLYSDAKGSDWAQAEYDMSPKAGQVFFNQNAASDTGTTAFLGATTLGASADLTASGTDVNVGSQTLDASADITAAGTIVSAGVLTGVATLGASADLTATGTDVNVGSQTLGASADVTATGTTAFLGATTLGASADLTASGTIAFTTAITMGASGDITATPTVALVGSTDMDASADLTASGTQTVIVPATLGASADLSALGTVLGEEIVAIVSLDMDHDTEASLDMDHDTETRLDMDHDTETDLEMDLDAN